MDFFPLVIIISFLRDHRQIVILNDEYYINIKSIVKNCKIMFIYIYIKEVIYEYVYFIFIIYDLHSIMDQFTSSNVQILHDISLFLLFIVVHSYTSK